MSENHKLRIPCLSYDDPHFVDVDVELITLKGYEEFQFCVHHRVVRDLESETTASTVDSKKWTVSGYPCGFAVENGTNTTKESAIIAAKGTLRKHSLETIRNAFSKAEQARSKWISREPS